MAVRHTVTVRCTVPMRPCRRRLLRRAVTVGLRSQGVSVPCRVDVLAADDRALRRLNRRMRGIDRPTDVLSFPALCLTPGQLPTLRDADPGTRRVHLGDMAISLERTAAQAQEYGHSLGRELSYLAVHSLLHLLGYDHEDQGPQKRQMRRREEAILQALGQHRRCRGPAAKEAGRCSI